MIRNSLSLIVVLCLVGCGSETPAPPSTLTTPSTSQSHAPAKEQVKVRLALNWFPEAEHGGYYQAKVRGLYAKQGIAMEIIKGGPGTPVEIEVGAGRMDFGIVNADKILSTRAEGVPIVGLMAPFQISPRCIIVRDDSPVKTLADLQNLTLIANGTKPFVKYLQHKYGLAGVDIIPYKGGMATFLANDNAAMQGYFTSEPYVLTSKGVKVRSLMLADDGFNPYTSVLVTSEEMIAEHPDVVQNVVRASQTGWLSYLVLPRFGNAEIASQSEHMDAEVLKYGAKQQRLLMLVGDAATSNFGQMTEVRWQQLHDQLVEVGATKKSDKPVTDAFTTQFLD